VYSNSKLTLEESRVIAYGEPVPVNEDIAARYPSLAGIINVSVSLEGGDVVSFSGGALRTAWETSGMKPGENGFPEHSIRKAPGTRIPEVSLL